MPLSTGWGSLGMLFVVAALFGGVYDTEPPGSRTPLAVLQALNRISEAAPLGNVTIALGFNACLDLVTRAADVLVFDESTIGATEHADFDRLHSEAQLNEAFLHSFVKGAAAERSCDEAAFAGVVQRAAALPAARKNLGGNAALMARRLARAAPKARVLLGGHVGVDAAALLPPSVNFVTPVAPSDEVHLILEYGADERVHSLQAPRANRFIVTADVSNTNVDAMLETIEVAIAQRADVLVIAGLHMLEPLSAEQRAASLQRIQRALVDAASAASSFLVHVELASTTDASFMRLIARTLFPLASSLGLNEQEAVFLYEAVGGVYGSPALGQPPSTGDVAGAHPDVRSVAHLLRYVIEAFPSLTRVHFHALAFHVIAYQSSAVGSVWRGRRAAVSAGSVAATLEACQADMQQIEGAAMRIITDASVVLTDERVSMYGAGDAPLPRLSSAYPPNLSGPFPLDSATPALAWRWAGSVGDLYFALAPVAVCGAPVSTVGLGDAISASGLAVDALSRDSSSGSGALLRSGPLKMVKNAARKLFDRLVQRLSKQ